MSVLFSRQCEYALQAILYLAAHPSDNLIPIRTVADKLKIPYHFVSKTLQQLAKSGLIHSQRGKQGGFAVDAGSAKVSLFEIINAIDGPAFSTECVLGFKDCNSKEPCLLHEVWAKQRDELAKILTKTTIKQLIVNYKKIPALKKKLGLK